MIFSARFSFNHIYIFQSLRDKDLKCSEILYYDYLKRLAEERSMKIDFFNIINKAQFLEKMDLIWCEAKIGHKPFIHIDMHGDETKGLEVNPTLEIISWNEFKIKCQQINKQISNNLAIVLASCFGLTSILNIDIRESTPYNLLIASERVVSAGYINDKFPKFYENLLSNYNVSVSLKYIEKHYKLYLSEQLFTNAYIKYLNENCRGKGRKQRIERLLTEYKRVHPESLIGLKEARNYFKEHTKPDFDEFLFYFNTFLMANHECNYNRFDFLFGKIVDIFNNKKK